MRTLLVTLSLSTCATILIGCALLTRTPDTSHDPVKVACESFRLITWAPGNDRMATDILEEIRLGRRGTTGETLTQLREVLGDTAGTIQEVKPHNAAYRALCTKAASESP